MKNPEVPAARVRSCNATPIRPDGEFVLYWMTATRRTTWSYGLQRAVGHAVALGRPLVVLEALRAGYPWASDRHHRFVLQGMADNRARLARTPVLYHPYVESRHGEGRGLLEALARRACLVVTDDFPAFFLPRMVDAAALRLPVRLEAVDGNGLLPMRLAEQAYPTAYAFRRYLQKTLPAHLESAPEEDPLAGVALARLGALGVEITARWPAAGDDLLAGSETALARLAIDHDVPPAPEAGGPVAGGLRLDGFLDARLASYGEERNQPEKDAASGLSAHLHYGHVSVHEILHKLALRESWSPERLAKKAKGERAGWWGMSPSAESFLDELVTWRELGFNFCSLRHDYDRFDALPDWARRTLAEHAGDARVHVYDLRQFERAETHDPLWNAAQTQLVREGRIHNYLRMLWGKKILEWTASPEDALAVMVELNNKHALDGRDPNSYSGIFWVLGRYDRPWGPVRPIFGTIRYMSSENTARKVSVKEYLRRFAPQAAGGSQA
jgi:deoxyribodipyrimidine photo-lyase